MVIVRRHTEETRAGIRWKKIHVVRYFLTPMKGV